MNDSGVDRYKDIINLPHHRSERHPPLSREQRAAQFSSFAALEGHEENIEETARLTSAMVELTQEQKDILSKKLIRKIESGTKARIVYFIPDASKSGGRYAEIEDHIRRLEDAEKKLYLRQGLVIPLNLIVDLR